MVSVLREVRGATWSDPLVHAVDASACKSMVHRHGSGGLKHMDTENLRYRKLFRELAREVHAADSLASVLCDQLVAIPHEARQLRADR